MILFEIVINFVGTRVTNLDQFNQVCNFRNSYWLAIFNFSVSVNDCLLRLNFIHVIIGSSKKIIIIILVEVYFFWKPQNWNGKIIQVLIPLLNWANWFRFGFLIPIIINLIRNHKSNQQVLPFNKLYCQIIKDTSVFINIIFLKSVHTVPQLMNIKSIRLKLLGK